MPNRHFRGYSNVKPFVGQGEKGLKTLRCPACNFTTKSDEVYKQHYKEKHVVKTNLNLAR